MWFSDQKKDVIEDNRTEKRKLGDIGENAVCEYFKSKGFEVLDRNYFRKWGEIDIVARKGKKLHFIEVKSVSYEILDHRFIKERGNISREIEDSYRAEDNVHPWKLKRLSRIIQTYLLDNSVSDSVEWQFDVVVVKVDQVRKICKVSLLDDVVL
jgi:putative endonuclease